MSISVLEQLAFEAEVIEAPLVDVPDTGETVGDLIDEDRQLPPPVDMLQHADKAREIADQLDDLAERADDLADEDERYSGLSVESLGREFSAILRSENLNSTHYKAHSFESAVNNKQRATGMARDARRVATDLRCNATAMDNFSPEGVILDLFKNKDKTLMSAKLTLQRELGSLKGAANVLRQGAVAIGHKGVAKLLTAGGNTVANIPAAVRHDIDWTQEVDKFIHDTVSSINDISETSPHFTPGDLSKVITKPDGVPILRKGDDAAYSLMGNFAVVDTMGRLALMDGGGNISKLGMGGAIKAIATIVLVGAIGGPLIASTAMSIAGGPTTGAFIGSQVAAGALGIEAGTTLAKDLMNKSDAVTALSIAELEKCVHDILGLEKYWDSTEMYRQIDAAEKHLRSVKLEDKAVLKAAHKELGKVKSAVAILKQHSFFLMTEFARLMEQTVKLANKASN